MSEQTATKGKTMSDLIPAADPEQSWPTAADLITTVETMVKEDLAAGEPVGDLEDYLDFADELFPDAPQGVPDNQADAALGAYHARAVAIMNEARAVLEARFASRRAANA